MHPKPAPETCTCSGRPHSQSVQCLPTASVSGKGMLHSGPAMLPTAPNSGKHSPLYRVCMSIYCLHLLSTIHNILTNRNRHVCSAAKLCHFVAHGGQIIIPSELAEVVLADWTGSVPPMPSACQSLFLTANHAAGSNHTGSNWDSAKSSPASTVSRYACIVWSAGVIGFWALFGHAGNGRSCLCFPGLQPPSLGLLRQSVLSPCLYACSALIARLVKLLCLSSQSCDIAPPVSVV